MNPLRLTHLKKGYIDTEKSYVMYWMQQSQRVHYNHALKHAIELANHMRLPLVVFFGLSDGYPEANARHYHFMLEGLKEVKDLLEKLHIHFLLIKGKPEEMILRYLSDAQALVMDYGYLKVPRAWRLHVIEESNIRFPHLFIDMIDTDLIVPVRVASNKAEYGAYTIRPKIKKLYESFRDFDAIPVLKYPKALPFKSDDDLSDLDRLVASLHIDHSVQKSPYFKGGYQSASHMFYHFIESHIDFYQDSNDPSKGHTSKLSMYLHFGQISALEILERLYKHAEHHHIDGTSLDQFIEQLLIRRELAFNYVVYHKGYDQFETMTEPWAYETMSVHEKDKRLYLYDLETLEKGLTHDPYFNAAMHEMSVTGYMHNYMRMYWAKKIIEWTKTYKIAYETILYLNNKYFIDGRDPNSYTGIAWCFGKHDRAWTEREVFGKLRYMNDKGLERKFDMKAYVAKIDALKKG